MAFTLASLTERIKRWTWVKGCLNSDRLKHLRHWWNLHFQSRNNYRTVTRFIRIPDQYNALTGPVLDYLTIDKGPRTLRVGVIGCSIGAETYSIASTLLARHPDLDLSVCGFDYNPEVLKRAHMARYSEEEVFANSAVDDEFVQQTFLRVDDQFEVMPRLRERVQFSFADATRSDLVNATGEFDVVFCQNVTINFKPRVARKMLVNVCKLLRPRAALFVEGVDLGVRERVTRSEGLIPMDYLIEEIHKRVEQDKGGPGWSWHFWGLEPLSKSHIDWKRRYSTIFLKGSL